MVIMSRVRSVQPAEPVSAAAVVGLSDPGDDRDPQLLSGGQALPVQDAVLQQTEEAFRRRVVAGGADLTH